MTETLTNSLPNDVEDLIERVLKSACDRDLTLATAESCTGGLVASVLTDVEGSSHAFERGFVTYTNEAKAEQLGVPMEMIERFDAVSSQVARAMAEGALAHSRADIAVSVTGFAGAGGPDDEEGLVHFATATRDGPVRLAEHHFGAVGRGDIRVAAVRAAMTLLAQALDEARPSVE